MRRSLTYRAHEYLLCMTNSVGHLSMTASCSFNITTTLVPSTEFSGALTLIYTLGTEFMPTSQCVLPGETRSAQISDISRIYYARVWSVILGSRAWEVEMKSLQNIQAEKSIMRRETLLLYIGIIVVHMKSGWRDLNSLNRFSPAFNRYK
ncbi:hypothetical protein B0H34DRAFT_738633 [Crassisporium funariophilum]|nr:hypothetical protein B0H34DRAFT_738633 [Crassisporium funariophilum]